MYFIGDGVTPEDLSKEEGYLATYPYNEVITAMAKRIKAYLKVEVPLGEDGKPLWWHLLFIGGVKDNKCFEWSLRSSLRTAIKTLIEEEKIQTKDLVVRTHKTLLDLSEKVLKTAEEDSASDFDRLFESIMMPKVKGNTVEMPEVSTQKEAPMQEEKEVQIEESHLVSKEEYVPQIIESMMNLVEVAKEEVSTEMSEAKEIVPNQEKTLAEIKAECISYYGAICDICGFDYGYTYGDAYEMDIEVHNLKGIVGEEVLPDTHPIEDLIPICHNCHHMLHSHPTELTVDKMRKMVKA